MEDEVPSPLTLHQEVAALRQRVAQLEAAAHYTEQIVETVRDPLLVLTPDLRVQSANPAFYQLFHLIPAETEGQLVYQISNGQWNIPALRTLLEEILPCNTVFNDYEVSHDFERIGPRTMLLNARRLDHVDLILLAMEDITARKQAATLLQEQQAQLEYQIQERTAALYQEIAERQRLEGEAQRAQHFALLGRLAAGLSHEIRNPLGAVFLHVELLEEELHDLLPESTANTAQSLTEIKTNLARLDDLLQDYLSLVRAGAMRLVPEDLSLFVTQFAQEMTPALTDHGITLQLDGLDRFGRVSLHQNTFRRVLLNLLHNAMEAMPQGGMLTLRGRQQATTVHLDISDTGIGIAPEQYTQIFEPLHTTKPGGTGLGLYIVQEVVAAHGGQVAVQSTVGAGTTFTITLPLAEAEEAT
jgi:two-component system, chemotaxis family, CheB/CheR fusion protein